jgi:hypothetical protein
MESSCDYRVHRSGPMLSIATCRTKLHPWTSEGLALAATGDIKIGKSFGKLMMSTPSVWTSKYYIEFIESNFFLAAHFCYFTKFFLRKIKGKVLVFSQCKMCLSSKNSPPWGNQNFWKKQSLSLFPYTISVWIPGEKKHFPSFHRLFFISFQLHTEKFAVVETSPPKDTAHFVKAHAILCCFPGLT